LKEWQILSSTLPRKKRFYLYHYKRKKWRSSWIGGNQGLKWKIKMLQNEKRIKQWALFLLSIDYVRKLKVIYSIYLHL
jgi:hypothetical protein